mmetsp:Transcript_49961/g.132825  ORF Transcript_49961/g.132825 Transcript_49961/m.132825 type:complete len:211 (-) Transcript_49961:1896-2528(-)
MKLGENEHLVWHGSLAFEVVLRLSLRSGLLRMPRSVHSRHELALFGWSLPRPHLVQEKRPVLCASQPDISRTFDLLIDLPLPLLKRLPPLSAEAHILRMEMLQQSVQERELAALGYSLLAHGSLAQFFEGLQMSTSQLLHSRLQFIPVFLTVHQTSRVTTDETQLDHQLQQCSEAPHLPTLKTAAEERLVPLYLARAQRQPDVVQNFRRQ